MAPSRMTSLAPWDPNYEAKAGPGVLWVSRGYLWLQPQSGAGMPWEGTEAPQVFPDSAQGPSCGSGASFSGRTLCHPSFWPLYEAASGRGHRPLAPTIGHQNGKQVPRDAGNFSWSPQAQDRCCMSFIGDWCRELLKVRTPSLSP